MAINKLIIENSSGRVGIGITNPDGKLDVSVASNQRIRLDDFGGTSRISSRNDSATILPLLIDGSTLALNSGSGGNVGIGTTSPAEKLHVEGGISARSSNTNTISIFPDNVNGPTLAGHTNSAGLSTGNFTAGRIRPANEGIYFDTSPQTAVGVSRSFTTRMTIHPDGYVNLDCGQLRFPASQNASANANTLDDYEEGTWTPVISGSSSGSASLGYGYYTKIGRQVTIVVAMNGFNFPSFSGDLRCSLPFTPGSLTTAEYRSGDVYFYPSASWDQFSNFVGITAAIYENNNYIQFNVYTLDGDRQTILSASNSNLSGALSVYLRFSMTYFTAT